MLSCLLPPFLCLQTPGHPPPPAGTYQQLLRSAEEEAPKLSNWALKRCLQRVGVPLDGTEDAGMLQAKYYAFIQEWQEVQLSEYMDWLTPVDCDLLCVQVRRRPMREAR